MVDKDEIVRVGKNSGNTFGTSKEKIRKATRILENEGYHVGYIRIQDEPKPVIEKVLVKDKTILKDNDRIGKWITKNYMVG